MGHSWHVAEYYFRIYNTAPNDSLTKYRALIGLHGIRVPIKEMQKFYGWDQ